MPHIIEPLKQDKKLNDIIKETKAKNVGLFLWHGCGDIIMFGAPFEKLKSVNPEVEFDLLLPNGLGQEDIFPKAVLVNGHETKDFSDDKFKKYDLIARINMPMSEGQEEFTKGEYCCIHELGISPVSGHYPPKVIKNKLISVHFQITCLPDSANPTEEVAGKIWNEMLEADCIPIETLMVHAFHNPENKLYPFVGRNIRDIKPQISTLAGLIRNSGAFVGVVSGNFHIALSVLPPERITLLEKDFTAPMFTKEKINRVNIKKYKEGSIKQWLTKII